LVENKIRGEEMPLFFKKIFLRYSGDVLRLCAFFTLLMLLFSTGFYFLEKNLHENLSWLDSLWWTMVTMTTVGYGDLYPQTVAGRFLIGFPTMLLGISIMALILEKVQNGFVQRSRKERGLIRMENKEHILILGFPGEDYVSEIVSEIRQEDGMEKSDIGIVTDKISIIPPYLAEQKTVFVAGNPGAVDILQKANVKEAKRVIVLADSRNSESDGVTLMRILNVCKCCIGQRPYIVAECLDRENEDVIYQAGADEVVSVEALSAGLIVNGMVSKGINPVLKDLLTNGYGLQFYMEEVPSSYIGKLFGDVLKSLYEKECDLRLLGVLDEKRKTLYSEKDTVLGTGSALLYISRHRRNLWGE
jgi:voltage-gated potassium channel